MEHEPSGLSLLLENTELVGEMFNVLGVTILVVGTLVATALFLPALSKPKTIVSAIGAFKVHIGRVMILGLEVLIAADIVHTVATEVTTENMTALAVLVAVRTFLSWTLSLEIEGHWPWQANR